MNICLASRALACSLLMTTIVGCGGAPSVELVPVTGKIYDGSKPVVDALVKFLPKEGRESFARTDDGGNFVMMYGIGKAGVVPGEHQVMISLSDDVAGPAAALLGGEGFEFALDDPRAGKVVDPVVKYPSAINVEEGDELEPLEIDIAMLRSR